jgi:3'-phosphoadenosine 5'-phosphosulfate sulfotransferase (PAPS reductase)/FAD synthetase
MKKILWFSCGATSAVACKLALDKYGKDNCLIAYIGIKSAHEDNFRFIKDCEKWYGSKIETFSSKKYKDQFEVMHKKKFINSPYGAPCTLVLKKEVRQKIEKEVEFDGQIFGFEFEKREINRAIRFEEQYPYTMPIYPLIENKLSKAECMAILESVGIELPTMYKLGYHNNNCIGCTKGGMGYWNKIRIDFPSVFQKMLDVEEYVGATALKKPMKDLKPTDGRHEDPISPSCGLFCQVDFEDIMSERVDEIIKGDNIKSEHEAQAIIEKLVKTNINN